MSSPSRCSVALTLSSMLSSPHPLSFHNTYNFSTSSLGCKTLCTVNIFLVLWSICLSSFLVHFKNGAGYLTRSTAQVLISFIRFLLFTLVSSNLLVLLIYCFLIFSFIIIIIYLLRVFHICFS